MNTKLQTSKSEPTIPSEVKTKPKKEEEEKQEEGSEEESEEHVFEQIIESALADKIDMYFGIVETEDGQYKMGNKSVEVNGNDIIIEGMRYKGTPGP